MMTLWGTNMIDLESTKSKLIKAIEQLDVHDHLCLIYESREEQLAAVIPFIRMGLERNEQCVYIVDENTAQTVLDAMRAEGVDADFAVESGALKVITKREAYLSEGYFDPDLMIQFLKEAVNSAKKAGFKALRATGEMTWALGSEAGVERLIEYEAKLNYIFPENDILAVCQYNRNRFKPEIIIDIIRTHPLVIYGSIICENFYYVPPDEFMKPKDQQLSMEVERLLMNILERKRAEDALKQAHDELEIRVKERTSELNTKKEDLQENQKALLNLVEDLNGVTSQLEATNKELEAFSYSVSHDLRAPLRAIEGFSQALLEDYTERLDEQGRDYLNRVCGATQKMSQLIDAMLSLSRLTRGVMKREAVDLSALARTIADELQKTQPDREVEFVIAEGVTANGDATMLRIVLENFLGNAWKFTGKHPSARIEFGVKQVDGKAAYFVRDDGAGFDIAYADKLFTAFQRLHTEAEFPGIGIGLATVQRIIHRHGGRVWAEGEVEKGATFYFTI